MKNRNDIDKIVKQQKLIQEYEISKLNIRNAELQQRKLELEISAHKTSKSRSIFIIVAQVLVGLSILTFYITYIIIPANELRLKKNEIIAINNELETKKLEKFLFLEKIRLDSLELELKLQREKFIAEKAIHLGLIDSLTGDYAILNNVRTEEKSLLTDRINKLNIQLSAISKNSKIKNDRIRRTLDQTIQKNQDSISRLNANIASYTEKLTRNSLSIPLPKALKDELLNATHELFDRLKNLVVESNTDVRSSFFLMQLKYGGLYSNVDLQSDILGNTQDLSASEFLTLFHKYSVNKRFEQASQKTIDTEFTIQDVGYSVSSIIARFNLNFHDYSNINYQIEVEMQFETNYIDHKRSLILKKIILHYDKALNADSDTR